MDVVIVNFMASRKKFDLTPYLARYIHFDISIEDFISKVKNSPFKIYEFDIRYAIEILQQKSIIGTQEESRVAREVLRHVGLQAFLSKESGKLKTDNKIWAYWKNNPEQLFHYIQQREIKMRPIWIKHDTSTRKGKDKAITEMIEVLYSGIPSKELLARLAKDQRDNHLTNVALSFFAEEQDISFYVVRKFYFDSKKETQKMINQKLQDKPKTKNGFDVKNLEIKNQKTKYTLEDLWKDPKDGMIFYQEAYNIYVSSFILFLPFLASKSQRDNLVTKFRRIAKS